MRKIVLAALTAGVLVGAAVPAFSSGQVTSGEFQPLDLPNLEIGGRATMIRTADGRTKISVQASGLQPGATYGSHVHNLPCDVSRGGGHYQDQVGGATTPPNELWPSSDPRNPLAGLVANAAGKADGQGTAQWTARPEAQSVVIHQTENPAVRIACADLE